MEKDEYKEPLKGQADGPPRKIRPWDDDEDTNYFMSEPSISEAESSEYVRPAHIPSLLAPRAESPSSTSSKDLLARSPPPASPSQIRQGGMMAYPNSPGTSLSSWDSPHLFGKQVQLYFSPEKTSALEMSLNNTSANKRMRRTSNRSTSSSSTNRVRKRSDKFLRDLKQYSVGAVQDAKPEDFDSVISNVNGADRQKVDAVIRNVDNSAHHTLASAIIPPVDTDQDETLVMDLSTDEEEEEEVTKTTTEERLNWEVKHSADDEKTAEARPRRARRSPGGHRRAKSGDAATSPSCYKAKRGSGGHRRTRSGDAAAASLMTGGLDWKGMQFDRLPIPAEHDDEDDHDHSLDSVELHVLASASQHGTSFSKNRMDPYAAVGTSGGFAVGSAGKNGRTSKRSRRNQRVRRTISREMNRQETHSTTVEEERMSRDAFSRYALESSRVFPRFVGRASPTNESLSTIEHYTSERIESDSSGHGAGSMPRRRIASDVNLNTPNRTHRATYSASEIYGPALEHRVSEITFDSRGHGSPSSWLSSKHEWGLSAASWDPQYAAYYRHGSSEQYQFAEENQFADAPELPHGQRAYQFRGGGSKTPDDSSSDYSRSDDAVEDGERDVDSNRLRYEPDVEQRDELEKLVDDGEFRGKSHHVLRRGLSPLKDSGKTASTYGTSSRVSYMPSSHSAGDYPTFVCPVCKMRQREFFTASSAPSQFQGPAGYLALYFAVYVIAALFIFGLEEGWPALDCVYFAVITLTTAGLGDFVPTSDGAKILCSIFIYFGVACIGLLLGSYLASMLDDKSYKQAQKNRVENCPNCTRLKNLRMIQMRRQRQDKSSHSLQSSSIQSMRSVGFMSERNQHDLNHLGPRVLEREQKRAKSMAPVFSQDSSSAVPNSPSMSATWKAFEENSKTASHDETGEENPEKVNVEDVSSSGSQENPEDQQEVKDDLEVIDSYRQPLTVMMRPDATPVAGNMSAASRGVLGSPLTAQILGRQSRTRHMSFSGSYLDVTPERRFVRPRGYSEDLSSRPQFAEAIAEDVPIEAQPPKSWSKQNLVEESETEEDYDEESLESETSLESDDTLDEAQRRIKTAKYVFLTLKQALMNSILIILIGSLGFFGIEGMSVVDSFYFTTCLLTTVGYGDIVPVTSAGKLFATIYVLVAGTILLHNMSIISFIPLELRKRRIEQAVLTQFGDQLDDSALRELATGPLVQNLQLSTHSMTGLEECTRETFALAMLVRLGKVSETDIKQTFKAFRRLDVDNEGVLTTKSIIAGMVQKHRSSRTVLESQRSQQQIPPPPPPPFADLSQRPEEDSSRYWFGIHGSLHVESQRDIFRPEEYVPVDTERSSLVGNNTGYDSFGGQRAFGGPDVEQGYARE